MANNGQIKIQIGGDASQFTQAAGQAGSAAAGFGKAIGAAGAASEHAFDEIAAGAAAMDRITAAIGKMVGAALAGDTGLDKFASTAIKAITPLSTFERRLEEINTAIGRIGTVQGAAQLGVQFDILNRNLQSTRKLIDDATKSAVGLSRAFNTVASSAGSLNRLSPAIKPALTDLKLMAPTANSAADALKKLTPGASQATFALTNLGRVAQDAPFGLIGIANNIEPLIASFISLRATTGSAGGAFKALGASLMGPGGLILAVGLLSTVATLVGQGLFKASSEADKFAEAASDANKEAGKEIAELRILTTVASDVTRSMKERKQAAKDLQKQLKESNITLTEEAILNGRVAGAIKEATIAIKERARARAIETRIAELTAENLDREIKRPVILGKILDLQKQYNAAREKESKIPGAPSTISRELVALFANAKQELLDLDQATLDASAEINKLIATVKAEDITPKFEKGTKEAKEQDATLQALRKELAGYEKQLADINELRKQGALPISEENDALALQLKIFDTLRKIDEREVTIKAKPKLEINPRIMELQIQEAIKESGVRSGSPIEIPLIITPRPLFSNQFSPADIIAPEGIAPNAFDGVVNALRASAERAKVQATQIIIDLKDLLSGVLVNAFTGLGESLGAAFAGGGFSNVINGFISVIGDAISALGKAAIQAGTAALLLKKTLQKFIVSNPALVIAAGVAAVAIGSALKNAFNNTKVPGFADGVTNFSGGAALVGERGPEIVTLPAGANVIPSNPFDALSNITLASQIRGDDIFLSYNRTSGRRRRV